MQDKINSFNAAFVDLAAAYVRRMANKIAGNETYTAEPPAGPLRWGMSLADEMRVANLLSTIYSELRRGQDGSRLQNQRLRYNADLAQLRVQQSFERRGRRAGKREGAERA